MSEQWIKIAEFPLTFNYRALQQRLAEQAIDSRFTEENGQRLLWVAPATPLDEVIPVVRQIVGEQASTGLPSASGAGLWPTIGGLFRRLPVVMICLLLSAVGAVIVSWQFQWVHWLTYQDFSLVNPREIAFGPVSRAWQEREYWRLITPVFLHFGIFHLAFNGLWLWEFGRRIEALAGSFHLLLLILVSGVASNWSQYLWNGPSLFGGMSGVLYALLGYIWIRQSIAPSPVLALPRGIIVFMLVWLVLCMTGIVDLVMRGSIANAAHASGLLVGMLLGAVFGVASTRRGR